MRTVEILADLRQRNVLLTAEGDRLRYRAPVGAMTPELQQALAEHKAEILRLLAPRPRSDPPPPDITGGEPCPTCGAAEWWRWLDGSLLCRQGVIQGDHLGRTAPERFPQSGKAL